MAERKQTGRISGRKVINLKLTLNHPTLQHFHHFMWFFWIYFLVYISEKSNLVFICLKVRFNGQIIICLYSYLVVVNVTMRQYLIIKYFLRALDKCIWEIVCSPSLLMSIWCVLANIWDWQCIRMKQIFKWTKPRFLRKGVRFGIIKHIKHIKKKRLKIALKSTMGIPIESCVDSNIQLPNSTEIFR